MEIKSDSYEFLGKKKVTINKKSGLQKIEARAFYLPGIAYSTVTLLARFFGKSIGQLRSLAVK